MNTFYVVSVVIKILFFIFLGKVFFSDKEGCLTKLSVPLIIVIYCIINFINLPGFYQSGFNNGSDRKRKCFSNQRVLLGAMEMYIIDAPKDEMIRTIDDEVFDKLLKKGYLRSKLSKPEKDCEYLISGDLSKNGFIYCRRHGDVEQRIKGKEEENNSVLVFFLKIDSWVGIIINWIFSVTIKPIINISEPLSVIIGFPMYLLGIYPFVVENSSHFNPGDCFAYTFCGFFYALIIFGLFWLKKRFYVDYYK